MKLSRRRTLRGLGGATLALPLFESLLPRKANAQAAVHRFAIFLKHGNGLAVGRAGEPEQFWPDLPYGPINEAQLAGQMGRSLSELGPYASKLNIIKGINFPHGPGHGPGAAQTLSAAQVVKSGAGDANASPRSEGITADTYIEKSLSPGRSPLTMWTGPDAGYVGYRLSYLAPRMPASADRNPQTVFNRLTNSASTSPAVQQRLNSARLSINDLIRKDLAELKSQGRLSPADRGKLDTYLDSVRDLEVKLACIIPDAKATELGTVGKTVNSSWLRDGSNNDKLVRLQCDLAALAVACGATHTVSIQVGDTLDASEYTIPVNGGMKKVHSFHQISHRTFDDGASGTSLEMAGWHAQIDRLHTQTFKYLLDQLSALGILDNGVAVWCFDQGDGFHLPINVPFIVAGSGAGYLKTGQFIDNGGAAHNKLLNTLINATGARKAGGLPVDDFGDPTLPKGEMTSIKA